MEHISSLKAVIVRYIPNFPDKVEKIYQGVSKASEFPENVLHTDVSYDEFVRRNCEHYRNKEKEKESEDDKERKKEIFLLKEDHVYILTAISILIVESLKDIDLWELAESVYPRSQGNSASVEINKVKVILYWDTTSIRLRKKDMNYLEILFHPKLPFKAGVWRSYGNPAQTHLLVHISFELKFNKADPEVGYMNIRKVIDHTNLKSDESYNITSFIEYQTVQSLEEACNYPLLKDIIRSYKILKDPGKVVELFQANV